MRRWLPAIAAAGVLGAVVVAGMSGKGSGDEGSLGATSTVTTIASASTSAGDDNPGAVDVALTVPASTEPNVVVESSVAVPKTTITQSLSKGMYGQDVKALQQRLTDLHFAPGPVDGAFGSGTQQAVWAYKKLVMGMTWQQLDQSDSASVVTPDMWSQMQDPIVIQPRRSGPGTHVEIYLPQQVLIVFTDDAPVLITHIASGDDATWCELLHYDTDEKGNPIDPPRESDECGVSYTPGGVFKFYRRYTGNRVGALGGMYNPVYFNYGIAVHGAQNVPTHPASHGCIRLNMDIAEYFPSLVDNGDLVYVWGQDGKEPEAYTKRERTPIFNYKNPDSTTTTSSTTTTTTTTAPTTTVAATTTAAPTTAPPRTTVAATNPPATTVAPTVPPTTVAATSPATTAAPTGP